MLKSQITLVHCYWYSIKSFWILSKRENSKWSVLTMMTWGYIYFFDSVSHYFTLLCWDWTAFVFEDFHFYGNFRQVDHDFTLEKPSHGINRTAAAIATDGSGKVENQDGPKVSSIIPSLPKDHQELWEFDMFSRLANRSS